MKISLRKNSVSTMLLLKSMPVLLFCLFFSSALIVAGYLRHSERLIAENTRLHAQRVADVIDAEIASAAQTLINQEKTWSSELRTPQDLEKYLDAVVLSNSGFVTFGVITEKGYERQIGDSEFTPSYIQTLEFVRNQDPPIRTTGITSSYGMAMDIWFEFSLKMEGQKKTTIRALYRLKDYMNVVEQIVTTYPETIIVLKLDGANNQRFSVNRLQSDFAEAKSLELNPTRGFETIDLLGASHYVFTRGLKKIQADLIYAPLKSEIDGLRLFTIISFLGLNVIGIGFAGFLIARSGRVQKEFLVSAADNLKKIGFGEEQPIFPYSDTVEYQSFTDAVTELIRLQSEGKVQTEVINKAIFELFACNDSHAALMKCVELICTQCQAETAWFEPFVADQEFYRQEKQRNRKIKGWLWKNHRISDFNLDEVQEIHAGCIERNIVHYTIKANLEVIGTLKAYYTNNVEDRIRLMLDSLISILEKTLARHDAIKKGVLRSTEFDVADTIRKSALSSVGDNSDSRIAQYHKPAERLGGDWFYIIPDKAKDSCYLMMGRVSGQGILQGLLTAGVKGGLDVLDNLIRFSDTDPFKSPEDVIPVIQRAVNSMNKVTESLVTCFVMHVDFVTGAVSVASNGQALPLIVRPNASKSSHVFSVDYESKSEIKNGIQICKTVMQKGDYIVAFSDGLSNSRGFKSEIFERFMVRSLESRQAYHSASELVDDLRNIYNYYTSNKSQNDDVCFIAIKVDEAQSLKKAS